MPARASSALSYASLPIMSALLAPLSHIAKRWRLMTSRAAWINFSSFGRSCALAFGPAIKPMLRPARSAIVSVAVLRVRMVFIVIILSVVGLLWWFVVLQVHYKVAGAVQKGLAVLI